MGNFFIYRPDIQKKVAIFGLIGFVIIIGLSIRWHYIYLDYNFNGRVDSIRYGEKGDAIIFIKQKKYILNGAWSYSPNNKVFIKKGDSMVKYKNSTQIKLIRRNKIMITQ